MPLAFEANVGQTDDAASFVARGQGYAFWATSEGPILRLRNRRTAAGATLRMRVVGGEPKGHPSAETLLPGRANYFLGNEPSQWKTNVARYLALRYADVYPGVDLVLHGSQQSLEYDFDVAPHTDPSRIAVKFEGASDVRIEPTGDLTLTVADGELGFHAPVAYQERGGAKEFVAARYEVDADDVVRFIVGDYDHSRPLTIDPVLSYSTYLGGTTGQFGGNGNDIAYALAVDVFGNAYLAGSTNAANFPLPGAPWDSTCGGCTNSGIDAFVAKIDPQQSGAASLVFATYLGAGGTGGSGTGSSYAYGVAADSFGNVYVTGGTGAFDNGSVPSKAFPTTIGAFQTASGGGLDAFLTKLNPTGSSLLYSTYIGGNNTDEGSSVRADDAGHAYVAGWAASSDFKEFKNGFKTSQPVIDFDGFVVKFDTTATGAAALQYGSYVGGPSQDRIGALAIDSAGRMYVTGMTQSPTFPVLNGFQMTTLGGQDSFMTMIDPTKIGAASLVYSTLISSNGTENGAIQEGGIAVDSFGMVYVTGSTFGANPANSFPTTPGAIKTSVESSDGYVIKIDPSQVAAASLVASTLVGGQFQDGATGLAIDQNNNPVLIAWGTANTVTCGPPGQATGVDGVIMVLDPALTSVKASTRLGGTGTDRIYGVGIGPLNEIYIAGYTESSNFPTSIDSPTSKAAYDITNNGQDAFLSVITSLADNNCTAPTASGQSATTAEDTSKPLTLAATDADGSKPTPDALAWTVVSAPTHGNLDVGSGPMTHGAGANYSAAVTYTPAANYSGPDSFTFRVSDGWFTSNTVTVTLSVTPVNDPPSPGADSASTSEDMPVTVNVLANDSDPEGNTLNVTSVTCSNATAVVNADKTVTVSPSSNFNGTVNCTYSVSDGTSTATGQLTVSVTAVNDSPSAANDTASTQEDTPVTVNVLGNDSDVDGDSLTVTAPSCNNGAGVSINADKTLTVSPALNFSGPITCTYGISDGNGGSASASLVVTVTPVNDNPTAGADAATTQEDVPVTVNVLGNDSDIDGDSLNVTSPSCDSGAGVQVNANKTITVAPALNFHGTITCAYIVNDGHGGTATGQLVVTVDSVNDTPTAHSDAASTPEDMPVTVNVLGNDVDVDGDSLSIIAPSCNNGAGVQVNGNNTITVSPAADFNGTIICSYTANDGHGGTASAQLVVTVTAVNDQPSVATDATSTPEDTPVTVNVLANDTDVDGDSLSVLAPSCNSGAGAQVNANNTITVSPALNFNGTIVCSYTADDGHGGTSTGQLFVTVTPVNDNPVAAPDFAATDDNTLINVAVLGNDSDPDGNGLALDSVGGCQVGEIEQNADGTITYKPKLGYGGADVCTYTVVDGVGGSASGQLTVNVTKLNVKPTLDTPGDQQTEQGAGVSLQLSANDPDGDTLTFSATGLPSGVSIDPNTGLVSGTPAAGTVGQHQVTVTVNDGNGGTKSVTFMWVVTQWSGINQVPQCVAAQPSISSVWPPNHQLVPIQILGVTDPDGGQPTITITRILQDEPTNTLGDGNTWIDGFGVGTSVAQIRAERSGTPKVPGNGRVYEIFFTAADAQGGSCSGSVLVGVPNDQGNGPAVDSIVRYDSTVAGGQPVNKP